MGAKMTVRMLEMCCNCNRAPARSAGRCQACYEYWRVHRTERPAHLYGRRRACARCGCLPVKALGLCEACYFYQKRTGRPRPSYFYDGNAVCKNQHCNRPLRTDPHARRGWCAACYIYRRRNGQVRPAALTGGPHAWCECGRPATQQLEVRIGMYAGATEVLDLCDACAGLERELEREMPLGKVR
jgi:hypothetical protein